MNKGRLELVLTPEKEWELVAGMFRHDVRLRAGLESDWSSVSPDMKQWYIRLVRRLAGEPEAPGQVAQ